MSGVLVRAVEPVEEGNVGVRIAALERAIDYPLGDDRFRIDHGRDYFAFFRRLGALRYLVAWRGDEIAGVLAAVRRRFPGVAEDVWYLGDLKVFAPGRGQGVPARLLEALHAFRGPRAGYGISMNPGGGRPNPVLRLLRRVDAEARPGPVLHVYSCDEVAMRRRGPLLARHRGDVGFTSLSGEKDLILASTGAPMPLLHAHFGSGAHEAPQPGHVHMFCTPASDRLDRDLRTSGLTPAATATVLHRGMADADWSAVRTAEI